MNDNLNENLVGDQARPRFIPKSQRSELSEHSDAERSDVLGSYTGTPADESDLYPVQDADDL
ncbi:hypothetical protein AGMMS49992_00510 [Clostridia bacterium]|nr:hypothetical protein AGMMS49992_00510 [Clostridia bacterium]